MEEARGLSYGITISTITEQAEEGIRNLFGMLGRLRAEAAGDIDIIANTEQAEENIRGLTGDIGGLGERSADIDIDVDTEQAQTDVQDLADRVTNLGHDPPDIEVDVDIDQARSDLQDLSDDIGDLGDGTDDIDIDVDADEARRNIRDLTDDIGDLEDNAGGIGSAFRKSFLAGIDSGNSLSSSLRSGVGGAITHIGERVTGLKDNVVNKMTGIKDSVVSGASSIKEGFTHPIETIKSGLGGAIDHAKSRFIDFVRGADEAADAADDVGDASSDARPEVEDLGNAAEKSGGKFEKLGDILGGFGKAALATVTAATIAVGGFAAASVNTGMAFDSSMSQVAATMGYSVAELNDATSEASQNFSQLREFAMEMGANTAFSASQAADALNYMALAGYDAETSMAMLPNVLNLAAAGGIELAAASDMVTDAQSALGLSLSETSDLVDKMAAASSKSNTSVAQLGDAILQIGGTAQNLAGGTTELSASLGILADNGIKGAEGGTALRNMILSLSAPTDKAAAQLAALGVEAFDAEGNLRPLNETFGDLNGALSTMTQEERTQALREIFNKVDLKSVNAMLGTSAERWDELGMAIDGAWVNMGSLSESLSDVGLDLATMQGNISKLGISEKDFSDILKMSGGNAEQFADMLWEAADAGVSQEEVVKALDGDLGELQTAFDNTTGAAQAMADTQLDNLAGDITLFQSALEGAQIIISDELSPSLRQFTQFGTESITKISEAFQEGGFTGAMGALGGILSDGLSMIVETLPTAIDAGMQLLGALGQGLLDNTPLIIDAAIQIVTLLGDGILSSLPVLAGAAMEIIASLASGLGEMLPTLIPSMVETVTLMAGALIDNLPLVLDAGMQLISGLADGIIGAVPVLIGQLPALIDQILGFLTESLPTILEQGSAILLALTDGIISALPMLVDMLPEIITSICGFVTENLPTILDQGVQILTTLATGVIGALPELIGQIPTIITGIVGTLSENFPSIVSTGVTLLLEFGAGIISAIPQLVAQLPAIGAAILGALSEIPGMVISVGKSIVEGLWSGISSMAGWVKEKVKGFASGIVDGIKGFLGIHSPSTVFAEIGDNMALGLGKGFGDGMNGVTEDIKKAIPTNLDGPEISIPDIGAALDSSGVDWEKYSGEAWAASGEMFDGLIEDLKYNLSELGTSASELQDYLQFEYDLDADDAFAVVKSLGDSLGELKQSEEGRSGLPGAVDYSVNPVLDDWDMPQISDVSYGVHPVVEGITPPPVSGLTYTVTPVVEDFNPPGYESYDDAEYGDGGYPEQIDSNGGAPEPDGSSTGNSSSGFTFAPVITIPITIEGNANSEVLEELQARLEEAVEAKMREAEARLKELYAELREEELQIAALKNQYAF